MTFGQGVGVVPLKKARYPTAAPLCRTVGVKAFHQSVGDDGNPAALAAQLPPIKKATSVLPCTSTTVPGLPPLVDVLNCGVVQAANMMIDTSDAIECLDRAPILTSLGLFPV